MNLLNFPFQPNLQVLFNHNAAVLKPDTNRSSYVFFLPTKMMIVKKSNEAILTFYVFCCTRTKQIIVVKKICLFSEKERIRKL